MYLSTKSTNNKNYIAGEKLNISISERTLPQIKVERPDNTEEIENLDPNFNSDLFSYSNIKFKFSI